MTTRLLPALLALSLAACGESPSSTPTAKPAPPAAPPAATAPATAAPVTAAALQAEAAKADKPTLQQVVDDTQTFIAAREADVQVLIKEIQEKAGGSLDKAIKGAEAMSTEATAELQKLNTKLEGLKAELVQMKEKLSIYAAELAKRPA